MLLRIAAFAIIAFTLTGCMSERIWDGADKSTAAVLEHSSKFRMESIDGSWIRRENFNVYLGGRRWYLKPGGHGITFFYDDGRTYTTGSVLLTETFEGKKVYRLDVYDRNTATGEMRFAIKPQD